MSKVYVSVASAICLSVFLCVGCGPDLSHLPKTVKAEGILTLDGKPVEVVTVVFIADTGNHHATGITDASGKFSLRAFPEKEGAVPGSYTAIGKQCHILSSWRAHQG